MAIYEKRIVGSLTCESSHAQIISGNIHTVGQIVSSLNGKILLKSNLINKINGQLIVVGQRESEGLLFAMGMLSPLTSLGSID